METMGEHTGLISSYQLLITAACTNTVGKMKDSRHRAADRCPFVLRHSLSQVTSFMQLGMLCKPHEMNSPCMFRSSQLFAGTSLTLFFRIFAASIIDSAVSILYKILFNTNNFNPHKRPILCWIMASCSQSMQRTWWPGTSTKIVTESYWHQIEHHSVPESWIDLVR